MLLFYMNEKRKMKVYTIRLPPDQDDAIEELAKELGITKSEVIRNALKTYAILKMAERKGWEIFLKDGNGEIKQLILP